MMKQLTDKQFLLLNAYYDDELKGWPKMRVERLINNNSLAYEYLNSLGELTKQIQQEKSQLINSSDQEVASWEGLASRINQEERNSLYLGGRITSTQSANFFASLLRDVFPSNLSKAFATACLAFVLGVSYKYSVIDLNTNPNLANNQSAMTAAASASSKSNISLPLVSGTQVVPVANHEMQLDWVKSDGRIRLIPADEGDRQKIIWVMTPSKLKKLQGKIVVNK